LSPQHFAEVSARRAHEFIPPAAIATADVEDFAGVTDVETCAGVVVSTGRSDAELLHAARPPSRATIRREDLSRRFTRIIVPALFEKARYDKTGAPTRPLRKRLIPAKLPTIRALVTRSGSSAKLKIISKVPPEALLSVSTVSRSGIEKEVAVLYPAVGAIAVPSPKFRWFKVYYAIEDRTLGCRRFPLG
jgi:hypothetical protein